MVDFNKLAEKKLSDVERPPLPPVGHYRMKCSKMPVLDARPDSDWYVIEFPMQGQEATEDVDPDELQKFGQPQSINLAKSFMCARDDEGEMKKLLWNVRRFLIDHLQCGDEDMSVKEAMAQAPGSECLVAVIHKQDKNDEELFHANLGQAAPLD